jgi:hypothetical protein
MKRLGADVLTIDREQIECDQARFMVVVPGAQGAEIGQAVVAQDHGLAIDHKGCRAQLAGGLSDQGISFRPVVAVPREQPHAVALALNQQPETVVLDLVHPVRTARNLAPAGWNAGKERSSTHAAAGIAGPDYDGHRMGECQSLRFVIS